MRLMGKRQVGQLQPYELVVVILISELAAVPMENTSIPMLSGIIPILILLMSSITLSYVGMRSQKARSIICGQPTILIERGQILYNELEKLRYNMSDLMEQLRVKNVPNLGDVEFAILETNGELSVIPKSQKRPVIPEDLQIATKYEGLPFELIVDGKVNYTNLSKAQKDMHWLQAELRKLNLHDTDDVLIASLDSSGQLFAQGKQVPKDVNLH